MCYSALWNCTRLRWVMACKRRQYCLQVGILRVEMFSPLSLLQLRILVHRAIHRLLEHLHLFPPCAVPSQYVLSCRGFPSDIGNIAFLQTAHVTGLDAYGHDHTDYTEHLDQSRDRSFNHVGVPLPWDWTRPRPRHTFHSCQDVARPKGRFVTRCGASRFESKNGL